MMIPSQVVTMLVGAERRDLLWTPELAAQWATVARLALSVVSVTPTPAPMIWVDGSPQPDLEALVRLVLHTATWEATSQWLALLTADGRLAETFLSLTVSRPMVYPLVIHFHLGRVQRRLFWLFRTLSEPGWLRLDGCINMSEEGRGKKPSVQDARADGPKRGANQRR
jgi:hypothetical protein